MNYDLGSIMAQIDQGVGELLSEDGIESLCEDLDYHWRDGPLRPGVTVNLLLAQVLHGNVPNCEILRIAHMEVSEPGYCQAYNRLPRKLFEKLLEGVSERASHHRSNEHGRWRGHRVLIVDGSSFSMPDTPKLQAEFGRPSQQREGCGFPMAHMLAVLDYPTGQLAEARAAPFRTSDFALTYEILPLLEQGDLLIGDALYSAFALIAACKKNGIDLLARRHQSRKEPWPASRPVVCGQVRILNDRRTRYRKPTNGYRPAWMPREDYDALDGEVEVREVRFEVLVPGCRSREIELVTTLLDEQVYPPEELTELYLRRWQVEVTLRNLKQTLKLDVLREKSPEGIHKQFILFALVFNLIALEIHENAKHHGIEIYRISFIDARRCLANARPGDALGPLRLIYSRPGRIEPRLIKRRPTQYSLMRQPRGVLRRQILEGNHVTA